MEKFLNELPKFTSYLGWKKEMTLTIKENYKIMNSEITCYQLDNVCDEINYIKSKSSFKDNQLQKKNNMEEYINYNSSTLLKNDAYSKVYIRLQKFIKEMKTNYMFMKGYEETYSITFNKRREKIINKCTEVLRSPKDENASAIYKIVRELIDSLLFNELYDYLFSNCLVNFYKDDEKKMKDLLKGPQINKFEWEELGVADIYHKCTFLGAIHFLDHISDYKTIFEKMEVLKNVNTLITEEAKNIYESNEKGNFIAQGDILLSFWYYVVAHCETKNIIAEARFIELFGLDGFNSDYYIATTFVSAVTCIKAKLLENDKIILNQYVEPNKISLP